MSHSPRGRAAAHPGHGGSRTSLISVGMMPIIAEDEEASHGPVPMAPVRVHRRSKLSESSLPPVYPSYPPPSYSAESGGSPDRRTDVKKDGFKDSEWFTRRGGWCRLGLMMLLAVILTVGLAVGLTIGIQRSNGNNEDESTPSSNVFPAGSFAFNTYLVNISTTCTSNPSTWQCYPYTTYSQSSSASSATFFWIIQPINSFQYAISSSDNPFSPQFTNVTMSLIDGNEYTERYQFNFTMNNTLIPTGPLDPTGEAATCTFPTTIVQATIWTRMPPTIPQPQNGTQAASPDGISFGNWPGQVEVVESQLPGPGVPNCVDASGNSAGNFSVQSGQDACLCGYSNFLLGTRARKIRRF